MLNNPRPEPLSLPFPPQAGSPMGVTSTTDPPDIQPDADHQQPQDCEG